MKATDLAIYKVMRRINNTLLGHTKNVSRDVKFAEWLDARRLDAPLQHIRPALDAVEEYRK